MWMRRCYVPSRYAVHGSLLLLEINECLFCQILKPAEKKAKYPYGGMNVGRPVTPPRKPKKKDSKI